MKKSMLLIIVLLFISCILSVMALFNSIQGEWICIATKCVESVSGDDWVSWFCRPNENRTDMICRFSINENNYEVPLSQINPENFKSCLREVCMVDVYVKTNMEVKLDEIA